MATVGKAGSNRDKTAIGGGYELYGSRNSYFTQKMQAALQWYFPLDYTFVVKGADNTEEVEKRSGTHQLPAMLTPENWLIADSTPMLTLLDSRLPMRRFYPEGIVGCLAAVMEEYFDEWSARWCIHTRWMVNDETAWHASE